MHIYAFIVLHMHNNAIKCIFWPTYAYIDTYLHIFAYFYMKIPFFKTIVPIICIWEYRYDTRVLFLQLVRLQVTR